MLAISLPCNRGNVNLLACQSLEGAIWVLKELLRPALFDDFAVIQHDDPIHVDDGAAEEEESDASKRTRKAYEIL
jgi:hypothetical protein